MLRIVYYEKNEHTHEVKIAKMDSTQPNGP